MSDNTFKVQRPNWLDMHAAAFARKGTQIAMTFGDGFGTVDILEVMAAAEAAPALKAVPVTEPALEAVPAADGGLFAVTLDMAAPVDGLF